MNKAGEILQTALGSVFVSFMNTIKTLKNNRGEVGEEDDSNPGDDALEVDNMDDQQGADSSAAPDGDGNDIDGGPPAEALKTDEAAEGEDAGTEVDQRFTNSPRFQEMQTTIKDLQEKMGQVDEFQSQIENANNVANFYQSKFNELNDYVQGLQRGGQPGNTGTGQPEGQQQLGEYTPPENLKNPGEWDSQEDEGSWVQHTVKSEVNNTMQQAYQNYIAPINQQIQSAANAILEMQQVVAKIGKDDYDDVVKNVIGEVFTIGPDGNVFGVKNPALLQYFKSQGNPFVAMYNHGTQKAAPEKIKQSVQSKTRQAVTKIAQKPKGPTKATGAGSDDVPELDWDTPSSEAEKILDKRGLIKA